MPKLAATMTLATALECPLCYEPYDLQSDNATRARVTCAANNGCRTFSICRLCVYRQSIHYARPFVVDDQTGDFVSIDPTVCPQCRQAGAFRERDLTSLSEEVRRAEEEEARRLRDGREERERAQAIRRLEDAPRAGLRTAYGEESLFHERIRIISGASGSCFVRRTNDDGGDVLFFRNFSTVGVPVLLTHSGVIYYEIEWGFMSREPLVQFGFSLVDGMPITDNHTGLGVGENCKSWGFDGNMGCKIHGGRFGDRRLMFKWEPGSVLGVAANVDAGMTGPRMNCEFSEPA